MICFLIPGVNREIQYLDQGQDEKEEIEDPETCAVFGVSTQQYFVNVENTPDLNVQGKIRTVQTTAICIYTLPLPNFDALYLPKSFILFYW